MVFFVGKHEFQLPDVPHPADDLAGTHLLTFTNANSGQITIRGEIFSVSNDHRIDVPNAEHAGNHALKHGLHGCARIDIDSDPLVVMDNSFNIFMGAKRHGYGTGHRPGQLPLVLFKIAGEVHILVAGEDGLGR